MQPASNRSNEKIWNSTSETVLPSNQKYIKPKVHLKQYFHQTKSNDFYLTSYRRDLVYFAETYLRFKTLSDTCDGVFWKNSERLKPLFVWQGPKYASEFIFQNVSCWDWLSETEKKVTPQISLGRTITHSSIICLDLELLLKVKPKNAFKRPFRKVHRFESEVNFNNYLMKNKH